MGATAFIPTRSGRRHLFMFEKRPSQVRKGRFFILLLAAGLGELAQPSFEFLVSLNNSFSASLTTYDGLASINCAYLFNETRTSSSSRT